MSDYELEDMKNNTGMMESTVEIEASELFSFLFQLILTDGQSYVEGPYMAEVEE